jgi:DNA-binding NtrC family response regulator
MVTQATFRSAMKSKVLLVDDDLSILESLGRALRSEYYEVLVACTGREALELLCDREIDLVLLDLKLPDIHGWDTFDQMMALNPFLPIIIITAEPNQQPMATKVGAASILQKPLALPSLLELMKRALSETVEVRRRRIANHGTLPLPSPLVTP